MKHYHTIGSDEGLRLPHSGFLVGKLAEALRLRGLFTDGFQAASYKTVQRYFAGDRVEPETVRAVLEALVDGLVARDSGLLAEEVGFELTLHELMAGWLFASCRRWDDLVARVNSSLYPVSDLRDLPIPVLRLVALDVGLRYGSWLAVRALRGEPADQIMPAWMHDQALGTVIDELLAARELTASHVVEAVGVSRQAVHDWRTGNSLPSNDHIEKLAKALAPEGESSAPYELQIRLVVAAHDLHRQLADLCGRARIDDLLTALFVTAEHVAMFWLQPLTVEAPSLDLQEILEWRNVRATVAAGMPPRMWNAIIHGAACPVGEGLGRFMAGQSVLDQEVAADFHALSGDWADRVRYWMDHLGSVPAAAQYLEHALHVPPEEAGELAHRVTDHALHMGDFDGLPDPNMRWVIVSPPPFGKAMNRAQQAERAASAGDRETAIEHWRRAIELQPEDALLHFKLGCALWQHGWSTAQPSLMEDGLLECHLAVQFDPEFGNARNEIGIILSYLHRHEAAERAFAEAEPHHGHHAHHWFTRGENYLGLGKLEEARGAFEKAIELSQDRRHPLAMRRLAATLMALGEKREARRLGKKVHHLMGEDPTSNWKAVIDVWGDATESG